MSLTTEQASILANIAIDEYMAACHATDTAAITRFLGVLCDLVAERDPAVLNEIEQYRLQMAGISTAAIGYWKEGDGILPNYDTVALRDVAKLYVKYDALCKQKSVPSQQEERVRELVDVMDTGQQSLQLVFTSRKAADAYKAALDAARSKEQGE